jgi:aminoglycoside N3'-acetyltransferase
MQMSIEEAAIRADVTRALISRDLISLGAKPGDILYLRCGLSGLGVQSKLVRDVFLGGIRDAIGTGGTIIAPAFNRQGFRWERNLPASSPSSIPITGAFSKLLLAEDGAYRSTHPTHSFVGLGPKAEEILRHHPDDGACFQPIRAIVKNDGLMALIGCVASSPGFSTVHLAQYDLGLSQRHYAKYLIGVRKGNPDGPIFKPVESPGCSDNFGIFYKNYVEHENFACGYVGRSWSIAVRAKAAYAIERSILERDPLYPVCGRRDCISCHTTRGYNKRAIPGALLYRAYRFAARRWSR